MITYGPHVHGGGVVRVADEQLRGAVPAGGHVLGVALARGVAAAPAVAAAAGAAVAAAARAALAAGWCRSPTGSAPGA